MQPLVVWETAGIHQAREQTSMIYRKSGLTWTPQSFKDNVGAKFHFIRYKDIKAGSDEQVNCTAKDNCFINLKKWRKISFIFRRTLLRLCFNPKYVLRQRFPGQLRNKMGIAVVTQVLKAQQNLNSIPDQYLDYLLLCKWICNWKNLGMAVVPWGRKENSCVESNTFLH